MPEATFDVVGDELLVTHNGETLRLSLAQPWERFDRWLELKDNGWYELHGAIRDTMPDSARDQVIALQATNALLAVEVVRRWSGALNARLGKCLSLLPSGESIEQPSPPTSGDDTASGSNSETPGSPKPSRRTPRRSSAT